MSVPVGDLKAALAFVRDTVTTSSRQILILDYDGTLAPFRVARDEARPHPGVPEVLSKLRDNPDTRLVVVSGRAVDSLAPLLRIHPLPEIWGAHGWEHRSRAGVYEAFPLPDNTVKALADAESWAKSHGLGAHTESKHGCLALHWRGMPVGTKAAIRAEATGAWRPLTHQSGLVLEGFEQGLELRAAARNKGTVVAEVLQAEAPGAAVAYLGDDRTDEYAFVELDGRGLTALVHRGPRATRARVRLAPPEELLLFLWAWAEAVRQPIGEVART